MKILSKDVFRLVFSILGLCAVSASAIPVVSLNYPPASGGANPPHVAYNQTIVLSANALDSNPITQVEFYANGAPIGQAVNTGGGTYTLSYSLLTLYNQNPFTSGEAVYNFNAVATNNENETAQSSYGSLVIDVPPVLALPQVLPTATLNQPYSAQIVFANSYGSVTYAATGLPQGLSINTQTGAVTGTPAQSGTFNATFSESNIAGTGSGILAITVQGLVSSVPTITSAESASGTVGTAFSYHIQATESPISYGASNLPEGLSISTQSGFISGTPSAAGTSNVILSATNTSGTGTAALTLTIAAAPPPAPVITSAASADGGVGQFFSYQITTQLSNASSYLSSSLPPGLTLNMVTGLISGTPTTATGNAFSVILNASNAGGTSSNFTLGITINPSIPQVPGITSPVTAQGTVGAAFNYQIQATNNPASFNATNLPAGITVDIQTGILSGTPNESGTFSVPLSATNTGGTGHATLTLTIVTATPSAPVITSAPAASGTVAQFFNYQITTQLNNASSYSSSALPPGLTLNANTGLISGTPLSATGGPFPVTLSASNAGGTSPGFTLSITIAPTNTATLSVGSTNAAPGRPVVVPVQFTPGPTGIISLQFDLTLPTGIRDISATAGAAATAAGKSVQTNLIGTTFRVILLGFDATSISKGDLVDLSINLTSSASGVLPLHLSNLVASDSNVSAVALTGIDGSITVSGSGALAAPTLEISGDISVNGNIAILYSSENPVTFQWGIAPEPAADSAFSARDAASAASPATPYSTSRDVLDLAPLALSPGRYRITIEAIDALGNHSAQAHVDVTLIESVPGTIRVYPNPWRADRPTSMITFDGLAVESTVKIFTVSGHWVRTLSPVNNTAAWDLRNDHGDTVASGLYMYLITDNQGGKIHGKLAIIK